MVQLWRLPVEGRTSVSQSSPGDRGERHWLSWRPKWEEGGHRRRHFLAEGHEGQRPMRVVEKVEVFARLQRCQSFRALVAGFGPAWVLMEPHQPHLMWLVIVTTWGCDEE